MISTTRPDGLPYWRLSGFYFFIFVTVGIILPYWSLYLKSIGMDSRQIGILSSLIVFSKIFITYFWGWIVDHTGRRMRVIQVASLFSAISFSAAIFVQDFYGLALILLVFSLFWSASLPQIEAATLTHLGEAPDAYTSIRVWGSIGFIVAVWLLGEVLEKISIGYVPVLIFVSIIIVWLISILIPEQPVEAHEHQHYRVRPVLTSQVIALFIVCFLMLLSHGPYYTFYSIYLEDHGYSRAFIGQMWALGVIAEVVLFLVMQYLFRSFSLKRLLIISLALAALRWLLIGYFVDNQVVLIGAQLLHAASFGSYHAVAIQYIHRFFRGRIQGRGQALYSSISFGAGMALGSLLSGYAWDRLGAGICFTAAAVAALSGLLITCYWIRD
ncbi:MAG TPA: MFS transporter [Gammaproteobacteria bacterium]|nr:MFS transporter [Gammaproteobacteria bacterium]